MEFTSPVYTRSGIRRKAVRSVLHPERHVMDIHPVYRKDVQPRIRLGRFRPRYPEYAGQIDRLVPDGKVHVRISDVCPADIYALFFGQPLEGKSCYDVFGMEECVHSLDYRSIVHDVHVFQDKGIEGFEMDFFNIDFAVELVGKTVNDFFSKKSLYLRGLDCQNRREQECSNGDDCQP